MTSVIQTLSNSPNISQFAFCVNFIIREGIKWKKFPIWVTNCYYCCGTPVFAIFPKKKTSLRVKIDQISLPRFCKTCFSKSESSDGICIICSRHTEQAICRHFTVIDLPLRKCLHPLERLRKRNKRFAKEKEKKWKEKKEMG